METACRSIERYRTSSGSTDPFNLEENALRRSKLEQGRSATLEDIMKEAARLLPVPESVTIERTSHPEPVTSNPPPRVPLVADLPSKPLPATEELTSAGSSTKRYSNYVDDTDYALLPPMTPNVKYDPQREIRSDIVQLTALLRGKV